MARNASRDHTRSSFYPPLNCNGMHEIGKEKKNKSKNLIDKVCPDMPEQKIKTSPDKADKEESKKIKVEKLESVY